MKTQLSAMDNTSNFDGEIGANLDERGSIKSDDEDKPYQFSTGKTKTELKEKNQNPFN